MPEISIEDVQDLRRIRSLSPIPVKVLNYQQRSIDDSGKETISTIFKIGSISSLEGALDLDQTTSLATGSIIFPADSLSEYGALQTHSNEEIVKKCAELELQNALLMSQVVDLSRQLSAPSVEAPSQNLTAETILKPIQDAEDVGLDEPQKSSVAVSEPIENDLKIENQSLRDEIAMLKEEAIAHLQLLSKQTDEISRLEMKLSGFSDIDEQIERCLNGNIYSFYALSCSWRLCLVLYFAMSRYFEN